jgi:anti-sigma B factor antagonist
MGRFEVSTSVGTGVATVALAGECDLSVRDELAAALDAAIARSRIVVVDLAELTFLDSSGVHGLVMAYHAAQDAGVKLYVVNALGVVAELLELTGVAELLRAPGDAPSDQGMA